MKPRLTLSPAAKGDLLALWQYIAADNPAAADSVLDDLLDASEMLAQFPLLGPDRPDLGPEIRYFPRKSVLIVYRPVLDGVEIVRFVRAERDLFEALADTISDLNRKTDLL